MAHKTSPFEAMPLELLVNVLSNMSTPEDVLATIKASPAALRAFMTGPERIYAAALEACLAPEIFRELLAIVNAPDHNNCPNVAAPQPADEWEEARDSVVDEWNAWAQNAYDFLKSHARGAVYPIPDPTMNVTKFNGLIRFMVQLYFCVSKFVNFYPTFARSNAAGTRLVFPPTNGTGQLVQEGREWPPLTFTERLRLQRGLLRYEMFCRLIGLPSVAASCNPDVCDAAITNPSGSAISKIWVLNPFSEILPMDEVEEIVCASIYVRDLYDSLRWNSFEEFHNHVLGVNQGRGDGVREQNGSDARMTAEYWLSRKGSKILGFGSLDPGRIFDWRESMIRLGLVFLDRLTRSGLAERRELMRTAFNKLLRPGNSSLLSLNWGDIAYKRAMWLNKAENRGLSPSRLKPKIPDSVLAARFTEQELKELVMDKYSPKDRRGDYQAMSQFVAGARAVVDFTSTQLPLID
ncbi:hypothetical protein INS49_005792 [Diaporthe citri]|uniref:uncharacterized protein n=1 Tax=Diaporthe citri TaxID=83186 RepID=UPI001C7E36EC|nr:uncharacterized protein INS49_005792 [Diaporthe citri]KAG6364194.1 hypothetical protein INS49_005792 [Diaporthe citri]